MPEGVPEAAEPRKISHDDLVRYMALDETLDDAVIDEIHRQSEIQGSPVQQWLRRMEKTLDDPLSVDWDEILEATDNDEQA